MKLAVLGNPVAHSLSPLLHRTAYDQLGLPHTYEAIEVTVENFHDFIAKLDDTWLGLSLTMPLKEVGFNVASEVSATAKQTGSINTLHFANTDNGRVITADNTDVYGIAQALREAGAAHPKTASILGAGATARSAIKALSGLGVSDILIIARNQVKAAACIDLGNELGINIDTVIEPAQNLFAMDVLINTTPSGVADDFVHYVANSQGVLLDVVYNPWPSKLVQAWQQKGLKVAPGYEMLLHQAVRQIEIFTGLIPDVENMRSALLAKLDQN